MGMITQFANLSVPFQTPRDLTHDSAEELLRDPRLLGCDCLSNTRRPACL